MNTTSASLTPEQALEKLQALYDQSVTALRNAISVYIDNHSLPDAKARADGLFVYPQLSVSWSGNAHKAQKTRAFWPLHPLRVLHHDHHASHTVPSLPAGTAHVAA
jgi:Bacterial AMP nucleoside phosphorylase N-terminus.